MYFLLYLLKHLVELKGNLCCFPVFSCLPLRYVASNSIGTFYSPMHVVVAMKVEQATGHFAGHALQCQRVGCQCLGRVAAPQIAFQVTLSGWQQQQRYPRLHHCLWTSLVRSQWVGWRRTRERKHLCNVVKRVDTKLQRRPTLGNKHMP